MHFEVHARAAEPSSRLDRGHTRQRRPRARRRELRRARCSRASNDTPASTGAVEPGLFDDDRRPRRFRRAPGPAARRPPATQGAMTMFGKLDLGRDPVRSADPARSPARRGAGRARGVLAWVGRQGPSALSLARMDHQRRPQADRRHVRAARAGDAAARLRRRDHDARAAGGRLPRAGLSAAGALQPDLLRARHAS